MTCTKIFRSLFFQLRNLTAMTKTRLNLIPRLSQWKVGWKARHLIVLIAAGLGTYAFLESRSDWSAMHKWNRAFGDMSLVLVALCMVIGPLARLWPVFKPAIPWRREAGIYGALLAIIHTVIILDAWVEWNLIRLFGYEMHPVTGAYVMAQHGFGLANSVGIVGLVYALVLACSSNNWSQRKLGGPVWKFLQQSAYVFWMLVIIHTAYFLYLHFQHYHVKVPDPNWAQIPFVGLVGVVALLQLAAFLKTWKSRGGAARSEPGARPSRVEAGTPFATAGSK